MPVSPGVVWVGSAFDVVGYGTMTRNCLRSLSAAGVPVRLIDQGEDRRPTLDLETLVFLERLRTDPAPSPDPALIVNHLPSLFPYVGGAGFRRKIGACMFEADRIPARWVGWCGLMDEIWVPSRFNRETFAASGVPADKLRVAPLPVDTEYYTDRGQPRLRPPKARGFVFLYAFALHWRKGFDLLLEAFSRAFTARDDVTLLLKTFGAPDAAERVRASVGDRVRWGNPALPDVQFIDRVLSREEMRALLLGCDAYVTTERGKGWDYPCVEAMCLGKPVLSIDWSGSTEYLHDGNAFLFKPTGRLVPVDPRLQKDAPIYRGLRWAEVTVDEVARGLRRAYEDPEGRRERAERGRREVRERFSFASVGAELSRMLAELPPPRAAGASVVLPPAARMTLRNMARELGARSEGRALARDLRAGAVNVVARVGHEAELDRFVRGLFAALREAGGDVACMAWDRPGESPEAPRGFAARVLERLPALRAAAMRLGGLALDLAAPGRGGAGVVRIAALDLPPIGADWTVGLASALAPLRFPDAALWGSELAACVERCFRLRSCDEVAAPTETVRRATVELLALPPDRVRVVPPAVDGRAFSPAVERPGRDFILHVGRPERVEPSVRLLASPPRLVRADGLSSTALREAFQGAALLLVPAPYDGVGLPVLEALASGCPVVAEADRHVEELGGGAVEAVPAGSPGEMASRMGELLDEDPARRKSRIERGVVRAAEFTWERSARAFLVALPAGPALTNTPFVAPGPRNPRP